MIEITEDRRQELKQIAKDLYAGKIFTDRDVAERAADVQHMLPMVFLPLMLLDKESLQKMKDNPPALIYEYIGGHSRMSVNGMPIFHSFRVLNREELSVVMEFFDKISEAMKSID